MINMLYMLVNDTYYNFSDVVMFELSYKLEEIKKRPRSVYYARFFMIIANHLCENLEIECNTPKSGVGDPGCHEFNFP